MLRSDSGKCKEPILLRHDDFFQLNKGQRKFSGKILEQKRRDLMEHIVRGLPKLLLFMVFLGKGIVQLNRQFYLNSTENTL